MHRIYGLFFSSMVACHVSAATLKVQVLDKQGSPLANAAVSAKPLNPPLQNATPQPLTGIMDQVNRQFSPHLLVVQKGAKVSFPNSDSIKHHVFSFSPAKRFELQLHRGLQADPLLFDKVGVVELGCNVHDWMLGYVYVVDTPYFGKTDEHGWFTLTLPDDKYQVTVWHPRMQQEEISMQRELTVSQNLTQTYRLTLPLLPDLTQFDLEDEFSDYD